VRLAVRGGRARRHFFVTGEHRENQSLLTVTAAEPLPVGLRSVDDPAALDDLNERVNAAMNAGGRYLISSTRLRGVFTLRMCILGFRTTAADVEGLVREVVDCAERLLSR